jgi:hypothetical protein
MQTGQLICVHLDIPGYSHSVEFWRRRTKDVLLALVGDTRMDGHFAYKFEMEVDANGDRVFREASGSLNFERHAKRIGPGIVPIGIIVYVDGTSIFNSVPARPVTRKWPRTSYRPQYRARSVLYRAQYRARFIVYRPRSRARYFPYSPQYRASPSCRRVPSTWATLPTTNLSWPTAKLNPKAGLRRDRTPNGGEGSLLYQLNMWMWEFGRPVQRTIPVETAERLRGLSEEGRQAAVSRARDIARRRKAAAAAAADCET